MKSLKNKVSFLVMVNILITFMIFSVFYFLTGIIKSDNMLVFSLFLVVLVVNFVNFSIFEFLIIKNVNSIKNKLKKIMDGIQTETIDFSIESEIKNIKEFDETNELISLIWKNEKLVKQDLKQQKENIDQINSKINGILKENKTIAINLKKELVRIKEETDRQISNIENAELSIHEMVEGIKNINDTVSFLSGNAQTAIENAKKGNMSLEKVVLNMNEIQQNAEDSVITMDDLGQKIKEIQIIVDVINSISSRTNLLALNATIEAEKAITEGNSGDGFIVVSDEIKKLALKSSTSTIEIEKIAKLIIDNKDKAIEQIDKNRKEVRKGITVVNEASKSFNSILRSTNEIGTQLYEVTSSSEQLDRSTEEIINKIVKNTNISKEFKNKIEVIENSLEMNIRSIDSISQLLFEIEGMKK